MKTESDAHCYSASAIKCYLFRLSTEQWQTQIFACNYLLFVQFVFYAAIHRSHGLTWCYQIWHCVEKLVIHSFMIWHLFWLSLTRMPLHKSVPSTPERTVVTLY